MARKRSVARVRPWAISGAITVFATGLLFGCLEIYARVAMPFAQSTWPGDFVPNIGFLFSPHATVRLTNYIDFWAENPVNSWGFLDREPDPTRSSACSIALIGDSFIEAAQVTQSEKLQVVLEQAAAAAANPAMNLQVFALGYSGTGQANQLPFYDRFATQMHPRVVILEVTANDFANNSTVLEAVRNGWHPQHPPRLFFERQGPGQFVPVEIDNNWRAFTFPTLPARSGVIQKVHAELFQRSYFYDWLYTQLSIVHPTWVESFSGQPALDDIYSARMEAVRRIPRYENVFEGWKYPKNDLDMDTMFAAEDPLPRVFQAALEETGRALDAFLLRAQRDGFELVLLASSGVTAIGGSAPNKAFGRTIEPGSYLRRLRELATARGITIIDQYEYVESVGGKQEDATFSRNSHWSAQGHRWAAEAVLAWLSQHREVCAARL